MKKSSYIEELENELWQDCVFQRAPDSEETAERWQRDEYSHLTERFIVRPISSNHLNLIKDALNEWKEREDKVLKSLNMSKEDFLNLFEKIRKSFLNEQNNFQKEIFSLGTVAYGSVQNMDWVNLFSWILPMADKENSEKYVETGRMVTALFYLELLYKHENDYDNYNLKRIEARWRLVNNLK